MSYGSKGWSAWVIEDQGEVNQHVKFAYVEPSVYTKSRLADNSCPDMNTVSKHLKLQTYALCSSYSYQYKRCRQVYSNGLSEVMLGRAFKELKLPREELVIMTKVKP